MYFAIALAILLFLLGLWNLGIAIWGSIPKNQVSTIGTLAKTKTYKNLHTRYGFVPIWSDCLYLYHANGKTYKIRSGEHKLRRNILKKVPIVYVKGFPRRAGIAKYRSFEAGAIASSCCLLGALMLGAVLYFIRFYNTT